MQVLKIVCGADCYLTGLLSPCFARLTTNQNISINMLLNLQQSSNNMAHHSDVRVSVQNTARDHLAG